MWRPGYDGREADDAATTDGGRPAVAGAGGELHGYGNGIYIKDEQNITSSNKDGPLK